MVSSYLEQPLRTLEQALEDLTRAQAGTQDLALPAPVASVAARLDPAGVLARLLVDGQGTPGPDGTAARPRRAA